MTSWTTSSRASAADHPVVRSRTKSVPAGARTVSGDTNSHPISTSPSSKGVMPKHKHDPFVLPGVQRVASPLGRVQGGSACAGCKGKTLARSPEAERSGPVKCRKRSGPEGSTLCTGYYLSKQGPFGETKATRQPKKVVK